MEKFSLPLSLKDLEEDFKSIGIRKGDNVFIHSSLSKIGWVIGGASTVISALINTVGDNGTIAMPSATPMCMHPKGWEGTSIPEEWIPKIVEHLPVFDSETTPTTMGLIPETFRNWPQTTRSNHPISSVTARGPLARLINNLHNLEMSESADTPYEKIYVLNFKIVLLGVGFNKCTMLHFAESKSKNPRLTLSIYPILENGKRKWVETTDMANDNNTYFPQIGKEFLEFGKVNIGQIGNAKSMLFSTKDLVDFATQYFNQKI